MFRKQHSAVNSIDALYNPGDQTPSPSPNRISTRPKATKAPSFKIRPFGKKHGKSSSLSLKSGHISTPTSRILDFLKRTITLILPRTLKGILTTLLLLLVGLIWYIILHPPMDPIVKARLQHERAERRLRDPLDLDLHPHEQDTDRKNSTVRSHRKDSIHPQHDRHHLPKVEYESQDQGQMHKNGLMMAVEGERHPIFELIEKGQKDWEHLLAKQSKTLQQAAREYRKRYRKNPPKGFEVWWKFAQQNDIKLVDEYDQIAQDIAPFAALEPSDFLHRYTVLQERDLTFILRIKAGSGSVTQAGAYGQIRRADEMAALIESFAHLLPHDIAMVFTIDDRPAIQLQYEERARMIEVASEGEYFGPSDYVDQYDPALSNFALACPPDSALRRFEQGEAMPELDKQKGKKSFIHSPERANDLCQHPEFQQLHGYTQTNETELTPLIPLYTFAKMKTHSDLLVTPLEQYWDYYEGNDPKWEDKTLDKLLWRGSTTGAHFKEGYPWRLSQRSRLHFMAKEKSGKKEILTADGNGNAKTAKYSTRELNKKYMDTSFSGVPAQCDEKTCALMKKEIDFAETQGLEASFRYKYLMDVDGNGWSGRFHRLMWTNSLALKSTVFPEWYAQRLIPWYHYVPVKVYVPLVSAIGTNDDGTFCSDYSDLYDIMAFFAGTPDGQPGHDDLAKIIASNGKTWAMENWRRVDMASYCFRMLLEVSRLLHPDDSDYVDA